MNKINFKDLPSTETPLSASNLNQMQTNIENEIELNLLEIRPLTTTIAETNKFQKFLLRQNPDIQIGDDFSITDNSIVCNKKCIVEINHSIWFGSGSAGRKGFTIQKNNTDAKVWYYRFDTAPNFENVMGTCNLKLNVNDKLDFLIRGNENDVINTSEVATYITIKKLANL